MRGSPTCLNFRLPRLPLLPLLFLSFVQRRNAPRVLFAAAISPLAVGFQTTRLKSASEYFNHAVRARARAHGRSRAKIRRNGKTARAVIYSASVFAVSHCSSIAASSRTARRMFRRAFHGCCVAHEIPATWESEPLRAYAQPTRHIISADGSPINGPRGRHARPMPVTGSI